MIGELANTILGPGTLGNQVEFLFAGIWLTCAVIWFIIAILICIWVYRDAESRGMSGVLWLIIVILTSWIGLIIYLIVRKPKITAPPAYGGMAPPPAYAPAPGYPVAPPAYGAPQPQSPAYGAPPQPPFYGAPQPVAVNCRYCGAPLPPGSVVCPRCGGRL